MDVWMVQELVKSHLMFAVREEVNGLKAHISELTLRNTRLEFENTLLLQNASPDTLAKLRRTCTIGGSTQPRTPPTPHNY